MKEHRGIRVIVSKGAKVLVVPVLVGKTLGEAESSLAKSGLRLNEVIRVHSGTVEKDTVIAQRPDQDDAVKNDFTLVVSLGPYGMIYSCPDFTGRSLKDALELAGQLGIKVEPSGQIGRVTSQRPKPGSQIKPGDTVYLQVEGGPDSQS